MIDLGNEHFVDPREVAFIRALPKSDKHADRVDVILKSGFLFSIDTTSFEVAQGLLRNIRNQIKVKLYQTS